MIAAYVPGSYEVEKFGLDKNAWAGSVCGTLPVGAFMYPLGWNDSRSGVLKFPEGMSGSDFVKKATEAGTKVVLVSGWQEKLKELLATFESPRAAGDFVRPPQAAWGSVSNSAKPEHRSRLAPGPRQPQRSTLEKGHLEIVFQCKATGFRTIQKDPANEMPLCHAGVKITIARPTATFATIDILEPCVHRASVFDESFADASGGRLDAPVPEPYYLALPRFLAKRVAEINAHVAVNTSMQTKPASTFGALSFELPVAEKLCANTTRSGGVTSQAVKSTTAELKRGGGHGPGVPGPIMK